MGRFQRFSGDVLENPCVSRNRCRGARAGSRIWPVSGAPRGSRNVSSSRPDRAWCTCSILRPDPACCTIAVDAQAQLARPVLGDQRQLEADRRAVARRQARSGRALLVLELEQLLLAGARLARAGGHAADQEQHTAAKGARGGKRHVSPHARAGGSDRPGCAPAGGGDPPGSLARVSAPRPPLPRARDVTRARSPRGRRAHRLPCR